MRQSQFYDRLAPVAVAVLRIVSNSGLASITAVFGAIGLILIGVWRRSIG